MQCKLKSLKRETMLTDEWCLLRVRVWRVACASAGRAFIPHLVPVSYWRPFKSDPERFAFPLSTESRLQNCSVKLNFEVFKLNLSFPGLASAPVCQNQPHPLIRFPPIRICDSPSVGRRRRRPVLSSQPKIVSQLAAHGLLLHQHGALCTKKRPSMSYTCPTPLYYMKKGAGCFSLSAPSLAADSYSSTLVVSFIP